MEKERRHRRLLEDGGGHTGALELQRVAHPRTSVDSLKAREQGLFDARIGERSIHERQQLEGARFKHVEDELRTQFVPRPAGVSGGPRATRRRSRCNGVGRKFRGDCLMA